MLHFKVAFLLLVSRRLAFSCDDAVQLNELQKRSRDFTLNLGYTMVSDHLLTRRWYKVSNQNGQYKMPDSSVVTPDNGCGTDNQIFIHGSHPAVPTGAIVTAAVSVQTSFNFSEVWDLIQIRNCSGELQYYLRETAVNKSYCFDPPEVQDIQEFAKAPENFYPGDVSIIPKLQWTIQNDYNVPHLYFECSFQQTEGLFYKIVWHVDGELSRFIKGPIATTDELRLTAEELVANGFYLGTLLQCGVQARANRTGLLTRSTSSKEFTAGIQVLNQTTILSHRFEETLYLRSTVPIGCIYPLNTNSCGARKLYVQMKNPDYNCSGVLAFQRCSTGIELLSRNTTMKSDSYYVFKVTTKFRFLESTHLQLHMETSSSSWVESFFANRSLPVVSVIVSGNDSKWTSRHCYSHVDPHMKTFDMDLHYENQQSGDFLLYRNTKYRIEVQERTTPCNIFAYCTCQVAVRAGGDVFVINRCPGTTKFNEFRSCNDGGILDVVKVNENMFKLITPIGTEVHIHTGLNKEDTLMNVDIFSSPKDLSNVEGLCGYYDNNSANDFKKPDGTEAAYRNEKNEFSNSWTVTEENGLLTGYILNSLENFASDNAFVCVCQQSPTTNDDEALCDTPDNSACIYTESVTRGKCRKIILNRRRSLSQHAFYEDLFLKSSVSEVNNRRERAIDFDLSEEEVRIQCANIIRNAPSVTQFPERLMGENIDGVIEQCVFDVMAAKGDISFGEIHARSMDDVVKQTFSYEPTYVANNKQVIQAYLLETCPFNCSGRGVCAEDGECRCATLYHGPKCELYEADPINVDFIQGGGVCDTALGDDCQCHWFYTNNLLQNFSCKFRQFKVIANSTKVYVNEIVVPGNYDDKFTGQCCLRTRNKRSDELIEIDVLGYEWKLAISNDGTNFGSGQTLYTIDQTCLDVVTNSSTNEQSLTLEDGYCLINFRCVSDTEMMISDQCQTCSVLVDRFGWTNVCKMAEDNSTTPMVGIAVGTAMGTVAVVCVAIWICCKLNKYTRLVGIKRDTGLDNSKPMFPVKENLNFNSAKDALSGCPDGPHVTPRDTSSRPDLSEVPVYQSGESLHFVTANNISSRPGSASGISFVFNANPNDLN